MAGNWQRTGGVAGLLFFLTVVASTFTPEGPEADDPTAQIVSETADDKSAYLLSILLTGFAAFFFLVFVVALYARLRAAEPDRGPAILVPLAGAATAVVVLLANGVTLALVVAADQGREPEAVRALFELDQTMFIGFVWTSAAFYAAVALSSLATGSLPRWLGWTAALLVVLFLVGSFGVLSDWDESGGVGFLIFVAFLLNVLWILATSIVMLRAKPALQSP
jgi:Domain of unknown function (DUF4386)